MAIYCSLAESLFSCLRSSDESRLGRSLTDEAKINVVAFLVALWTATWSVVGVGNRIFEYILSLLSGLLTFLIYNVLSPFENFTGFAFISSNIDLL